MAASRSVLSWSAAHRPEIVSAGRYPMTEHCHGHVYRALTVALHQHDYEGKVHIGEDPYELRAGDLTLTPAGIDSHYHLPRRGFHLCIHFSFTRAAEEARALDLPCHLRLGAGSTPIRQRIWWITDLYRRAAHSDRHKRALALAAASAGLQELLLTLALSDPLEQLTDTQTDRPRGRPARRAAFQQAVPPPRRHQPDGVPGGPAPHGVKPGLPPARFTRRAWSYALAAGD